MAQYIDKSALVVEIEKRKYFNETLNAHSRLDECNAILSFIDTLKAKEVDLDKEIKEEYLKHRRYGVRDNMLVILNESQFNKIAKHFFELGMYVSNKAQE